MKNILTYSFSKFATLVFINKKWREIPVEYFLLIWGNAFCVRDRSPTGKCEKLPMCQEEKK